MSSDGMTYALTHGEGKEPVNHKVFYKQKWEKTIKLKCRSKYINKKKHCEWCRISDSVCEYGIRGEKCFVVQCNKNY
jgi:hypothetical protein